MTHRTKRPPRRRESDHREDFREAASDARDDVRRMGSAARGVAGDEIDRLADEIDELRDGLASRVEQRPVQSLLMAAGAGVLVGLFLRR